MPPRSTKILIWWLENLPNSLNLILNWSQKGYCLKTKLQYPVYNKSLTFH